MPEGAEVLDLGLLGREEMNFSTSHFAADAGICVTASHNPMGYNGMKIVVVGSAPLDAAGGLSNTRALAGADDFGPSRAGSSLRDMAIEAAQNWCTSSNRDRSGWIYCNTSGMFPAIFIPVYS